MSEWITDRLPTKADAISYITVWAMLNGKVVPCDYEDVVMGQPWMPIPKPEPYVKPKRWTVVWSELFEGWTLREMKRGGCVQLFDATLQVGLINKCDEHREAAERIAAILNEVMP